MAKTKQFWLLKTEAREWSWEDQAANGGITNWDGVKNKQAQNYLKSMSLGDLCFFYHSGSANNSRRVVGVVKVTRAWYVEEGKACGAVDVAAVGEMRKTMDLNEMKKIESEGFDLFRQPRLSVVPVSDSVWEKICEMGNGFEGDGLVFEDNGDRDDDDDDDDDGSYIPPYLEEDIM